MQLPGGRVVGSLYKNPIDCLWKTIRTEGPLALYKGVYPPTRHFHCFTFLQARPPTFCELRHIRELLVWFIDNT